jgi:hypothetical protein
MVLGASAKEPGLVNPKHIFGILIKGSLRRADALKLYEIGYFVNGDILELGSYHGLSTCILSQSNHNSALEKRIYSLDLNAENCRKTMESLHAAKLGRCVESICSEAAAAVERFATNGQRFQFVFIDHSHTNRFAKFVECYQQLSVPAGSASSTISMIGEMKIQTSLTTAFTVR